MKSVWEPVYIISTAIAKGLMDIESVRTAIEHTPLSPAVEAELRYKARLRSTHYSTRIEGNRLTLKEAQFVIEDKKKNIQQRQRDVKEVRNYWNALIKVEDWAAKKTELTEELICRIHSIVEHGSRTKPSKYRDGQNVIRDSNTGGIVYLPPEAKDVPLLMASMIRWIHKAEKHKIPVPIIASLIHYQFVTIHPFYDGNGRTARLLATYVLQRDGYGLNGFFSMEEHHARNLADYYNSLAVHKHHNYYFGRAQADLTGWVEYFTKSLARVFIQAKDQMLQYSETRIALEPQKLRQLDHRARVVLALFAKKDRITTNDAAQALGLSSRMIRILFQQWLKDGWLVLIDKSNRARAYSLSAIYRQFIGK